jgi:phosphopantetheinyl transferase
MLDVWYALGHAHAPHALADAEQARADRFLCTRTAATYRASHTLKRQVLSHYRPDVDPASWCFSTNAWGKPAAIAPAAAPAFNLSHSGDCIAIAVADTEIGIDIERLRPLPHADDVARHVFHADELRWLARQPDAPRAFLRLWTLKESLLKAVGTGFSVPPRQLCWRMLDAPWPIAEFGGQAWRGATRTIDAAIMSVAVPLASNLDGARLLRLQSGCRLVQEGTLPDALPAIIEPLLDSATAPAPAPQSGATSSARDRESLAT